MRIECPTCDLKAGQGHGAACLRRDGGGDHKAGTITEAEARAVLRAFDGIGDIEPWIAGRPWPVVPAGWTVAGELQGWRFQVEPVPGGVRVVASAGGGEPAVWIIPAH